MIKNKIVIILMLGLLNFSISYSKEKIAVLVMENSKDENNFLKNKITSLIEQVLIKQKKFEVISRNEIDKIIDEQKLNMSGFVDIETSVPIGKISGINYLVIVRIIEKNYTSITLSIKIINSESGKIENIFYYREMETTNVKNGIKEYSVDNLLERIITKFDYELNIDENLVNGSYEKLNYKLILGNNKSENEVDKKINLPENIDDNVKIEWIACNEVTKKNINLKTGEILRQKKDYKLRLKAIIKRNGYQKEKQFEFNVKNIMNDWEIKNGKWYIINENENKIAGEISENIKNRIGEIVYLPIIDSEYEMDIYIERESKDLHKYIEINCIGGKLYFNGRKEWYFYENKKNKTIPKVSTLINSKENYVKIKKVKNKITIFFNGNILGEFLLLNEVEKGNVKIKFEAEKYYKSKIYFKNFAIKQYKNKEEER